MSKCIICDKRPARNGAYCANCDQKIESMSNNHNSVKPVKFLTYRGHVVGLYPTGNGTLKGRLLMWDATKLPKSRTLNLNTYLDGFSRDQIKAFKRNVLSLAGA